MLDGPRGLRPGSCGGPGHTPSCRGCGTAVLLVIAAIIIIVI